MMKNCVMGLRTKLANRKENNKGFTLVELIVVIVILAILAAILIPGLMKWIDKAKEEQYVLEARNVYLAAEATVAQKYATAGTVTEQNIKDDKDNIEELADVTELNITAVTLDTKYNITSMQISFKSTNGKTITAILADGAWKIGGVS